MKKILLKEGWFCSRVKCKIPIHHTNWKRSNCFRGLDYTIRRQKSVKHFFEIQTIYPFNRFQTSKTERKKGEFDPAPTFTPASDLAAVLHHTFQMGFFENRKITFTDPCNDLSDKNLKTVLISIVKIVGVKDFWRRPEQGCRLFSPNFIYKRRWLNFGINQCDFPRFFPHKEGIATKRHLWYLKIFRCQKEHKTPSKGVFSNKEGQPCCPSLF